MLLSDGWTRVLSRGCASRPWLPARRACAPERRPRSRALVTGSDELLLAPLGQRLACARRSRLDRFAAHELVGETGEGGAGDRGEDVEPQRMQIAAHEGGPDRPSGVHGGA